jgi:hypothetical protein
MQLAGQAHHLSAIQKNPAASDACGVFRWSGFEPEPVAKRAQGADAIAFSMAEINAGSSGAVLLEKLATTLPLRSTTYL